MIVNRSGDADKPPPLEHAAEGMLSLLKSITFVRFD